jgi:FAD:protein FMN transferase
MSERHDTPSRYPSRRDFLTLGIGAFVVGAAPWAGRRRDALVRRSLPVMGTVAEIAVVHRDPSHAQAAIDAAFAELEAVERTMSRFRADSDVGRANLSAHAGPVEIGPSTTAVLAEALRWAQASDGLFDPALARAVDLWDVGHRQAPPLAAAVRRFAGQRLYRHVELGEHGGRPVVLFHDEGMGLDLGGIAKGHAVDRAVEALRAWGIGHALVNAGGDLYALGRSPTGDPWSVGVRSPEDPSKLATTLQIEDRAVATSGDYLQFFDHAGRRYHHLLDPRTGEPRLSRTHSLTVEAATCMAADAAATSLFGCPAGDAARILAATASGARILHQI